MKEPGFIQAENRDARFEGGPYDGQVRPVWLGAVNWTVRIGDSRHVYHCKRTIVRDTTVVGFVFRYVGRRQWKDIV